ncbi:hypothetical protein D8B26_005350 [Coccidioides posadasii str. Silveira]|uniref:Predicted protein n=1 Tax=Coccidioides posadasii (strain RMSCC 757 / Silveira) TaxID=443226 RepID=E9D508_COCPS|nr:predicted protein [Coccidioides posadasii str. Silveira]QVM10697.1 hypothetical protein D8B26_005350 [Coccidioides posadasii str. Silveira]
MATHSHPEITRLLKQIEERYPDPKSHEEHIHDLDYIDNNTCAICRRRFFLPMEFGPCKHTFCLGCLWGHLKSAVLAEITCPLCRSDAYEFKYNTSVNGDGCEHTKEEKGALSLIVFFAKLQNLDGGYIFYDDLDAVYDPDLAMPTEDGEILSFEQLRALDEEVEDSGWETDNDANGDDDDDEPVSPLTFLLNKLPIEQLRGQLGGMRFVKVVIQNRLEELAPLYQKW